MNIAGLYRLGPCDQSQDFAFGTFILHRPRRLCKSFCTGLGQTNGLMPDLNPVLGAGYWQLYARHKWDGKSNAICCLCHI